MNAPFLLIKQNMAFVAIKRLFEFLNKFLPTARGGKKEMNEGKMKSQKTFLMLETFYESN